MNADSQLRPLPDRLWSAKDLAVFLGVPVATLHQWRYLGVGPKAYKVGRWLKYDPAEVRAWLDHTAA
jgi:hypothetical protein